MKSSPHVPPLFAAIMENDAKLDALRAHKVVPIYFGHTFRELHKERNALNHAANLMLQWRNTRGAN
jgi:hypothetical protein